ncbi:tetratricopeptide repeat protein [Paludisphaera soli]|uniref:tetratricopeptide repeat protein n=1 Tax=Paludisphaera soli TaxID=2712865 RepID=UPI0013EAF318|nr:tetratricopeptide repeat protein [Paludisphaera soli]
MTWLTLVAPTVVGAQTPEADAETDSHLASLRDRLEDRTIELPVREDLALEMTGTLDRSARAATRLEAKQARWDSAVALLDEFDRKNPDHPRKREFGLQAAVYRWAQARTWHDRRELFPTQTQSVTKEAEALDDAIARLRLLVGGAPGGLADNIRFRLAWALTDRAALEDEGAPTAALRREEALDLLKEPPTEPSLAGFHALLKAELLREAGKLDEAAAQVDLALKADPPPPEAEVMDLLVQIFVDRGRFDEARRRVEASGISGPRKDLLKVRIGLAAWAAEPADPGRRERRRTIEEDLVQRIRALREANTTEVRRALADLARSAAEFDTDAPHALRDAMAEGFEILGDLDKAAESAEKAAERAEQVGRRDEAGASRLRAGGYLFQAGRNVEAAAVLGKVVADTGAGDSRAKAGLLQTLALGRALAAGSGDVPPDAYARALERQLRDFPDDPTADEARWMLGMLEHSKGRRDEALALWKAVPVKSPRWIQSRIAACDGFRRALEDQIAAEERDGLEARFAEASAFLDESLALGRDRPDADRADLLLAGARLNLVPVVGKAALARDAAEQCSAMNVSADRRYEARLARLIALAVLGRYLEAEREAQQHAGWAVASGRPALLDSLRQIDLAASAADSDLLQRRLGLIARHLIQPLLQDESISDDERNELTFRLARALLFQGDPRSAQATLQGWAPSTRKADDRFLKDLADTYFRLEANELAIDVERLRLKNLTAGAPAWFDARYGLALAYYRLGRKQDALQLIEGTAILHPDLGGGRLRDKFIRLRQRLGSGP